jgi:hypothetical protein
MLLFLQTLQQQTEELRRITHTAKVLNEYT